MIRCRHFLAAILLILTAGYVSAQPYLFDFATTNAGGDTVIRIMRNAVAVPHGALVQVIKPGVNGVLDPPNFDGFHDGSVGGDDVFSGYFRIGDGFDSTVVNTNGAFSVSLTAVDSNALPTQLQAGQPFYIRVWPTILSPNTIPTLEGTPFCNGGPYLAPTSSAPYIFNVQVSPTSANPTWYPRGIIRPNGGETFTIGTTDTIKWNTYQVGGFVTITLNRDYPGGTWTTLIASTSNSGLLPWTVTGPTTSTARIQIYSIDRDSLLGLSDFNFTIADRSITVVTPNGGESLPVGSVDSIRWMANGISGNVRIDMNTNYPGGVWSNIVPATPNIGRYGWLVSGTATTTARIRVVSLADTTIRDESDSNFTILARSITLLHPTTNDTAKIGIADTISWTSSGVLGTLHIDLNLNYPSGAWTRLISNRTNTGRFVWYPGVGDVTVNARIRVVSETDSTLFGVSANNFVIRHPIVQVISPNGGEAYLPGSTVPVRFHAESGLTGMLQLYVSTTGVAGPWTLLYANIPTTDSNRTWTAPTSTTNNARVEIRSIYDTLAVDVSDNDFVIGTSAVTEPVSAVVPHEFELKPGYPNPFNPSISFVVAVPYRANVKLKVFNVLGQELTTLHTGILYEGYHRFIWNAGKYSSGTYFVKMESPGYVKTEKILFMR